MEKLSVFLFGFHESEALEVRRLINEVIVIYPGDVIVTYVHSDSRWSNDNSTSYIIFTHPDLQMAKKAAEDFNRETRALFLVQYMLGGITI